MRILFVGDVVGQPGREAVAACVPRLRVTERLDAVVVNCENAAHGKGITPGLANDFLGLGVDVLTTGNHVWTYREIVAYLESEPRLIRPANYPNAPGRGSYKLMLSDGRTLGVIQVEGRVFMRNLDCPFAAIKRELDQLGSVNAILVDVHGEATSEKQAIAWHFDGSVSAVIGSHTHVPTADERILPGGTAFLSDVGMTGPYDSVIGVRVELAVQRFLTQRHVRHDVATDNVSLCGVIVETSERSMRAVSITRVRVPWPEGA